VALGLAKYLRELGKKVSYLKPVGSADDADAAVLKEVLGLDIDLDSICPVVRTKTSYDEFLKVGHDALLNKIKDGYNEVSKNVEYVIIEGTKAPWNMTHVGLSTPHIANEFNATVICLVNFPDVDALDDILLQRDLFTQQGIEDISIVLNMVPPMHRNLVTEKIGPYIQEIGLRFLGSIFVRRELFSPSIREISQRLNGQMLLGDDKLDVLIDQFMVGSMAPENALKWFRRAKDKAVITSGDRSDICLTAMETDTNLLILTGGIGPDIRTIAKAKEQGVPIMMTAHDTYTTGHLVDDLVGAVSADDLEKVKTVERIMLESLDFSSLTE
jgi:BioD-like phosphotransacetylase family protein